MSKVLVLLADGFEEVEALTCVDYIRRAGLDAIMVSTMEDINVKGAHGIQVKADMFLTDVKDASYYRALVIPGGLPGATNLRDNDHVIKIVQDFNENKRMIGAICAGPTVLARAGILEGKKVTCYPGFGKELIGAQLKEDIVVKDGNIITSRGPATAVYFALEIIEYLHSEGKEREVKKSILLDLVENKKKS
ncbi:MAG: DJ-1/PfpI family protein [Gudongella sp.]|nr:DJ-1/PfpI family protein [Gudongella sp.]